MRIFCFGLFFCLGVCGFSQNLPPDSYRDGNAGCQNTLSGKITDFHDNSPLVGAVIIVVGPEKSTLTDLNGNFTIKGLCGKTYRLQISHPECFTRVVSVKMDGDVYEEIKLEHHVAQLEKIVVRGSRFENSLESADEKRLSQQELDRHSAGNLGDVLKEISGVSSLNTGNAISKPVIQGLYGSRVLIMNHGARMEGQEWGAEHAPEIDINSAGSISVIKGAAALEYGGDAIGGIVKIEPPRIAKTDSLYGIALFEAAGNGRGTSLTSNLTKSYKNGWYASLQGSLKGFGDFHAPDYVLSNTGFSEKAVSARFGFDKYLYGFEAYYSYFENEIGILAASHLGGIEDQIRALKSEKPLIVTDFTYEIDAPKQETTHHLAKAKFFKHFENLGKLSVQYDFQQNYRLEFDRRRNETENDRPAINLSLKTHHVEANFELYEKQGFQTKFGISGNYQDNFTNPDTGVKRLIPDYEQYGFAVFAIASAEIREGLVAEGGLRFDWSRVNAYKYYATSLWEERGYDESFPEFFVGEIGTQTLANPRFTFQGFSAVAGIHYSFSDKLHLFANYSRATRFPNPSELFSEGLHHSAARIEVGDLQFGKETANKFSVTLKKEGRKFGFSVNPYLNLVSDFIYLEPVGIRQTIRGSFQVWEYRQTKARLFGVDIDVSVKLSEHFRFEHRFSIVKGENLESDEALVNIPPANTANRLGYSNKKAGNLSLEIESKYVFRQNEFPDNRFEVFLPVSQTTETVDLSTPPAAYHVLGFHAGIDLVNTKNYLFRLGLSIENLFDNSYRDYLNRHRYYADNLGRNIKLRLNINF